MNSLTLSKEQSYKIQILRGLAIIAVVLIHTTPNGIIQAWCRPLLNFSVGLFLFLSGLLSSAENWKPWKRIYKVIIPYFIWTLIYVIAANLKNPTYIPIAYIKSLILANSAAIMYYIFVYCQFTLLIPIIDKIAKSRYKYIIFLIVPIEIILMRYIPLIYHIQINKYISTIIGLSCIGWFAYFYLGYLIGNKLINIKISTQKIILLWIISIILQIGEGYIQYYLGNMNCGTQIKITSIISGILFSIISYKFIISNFNYKIKSLKILGDNSFGIYFSHIAFIMLLGKIYHQHYILYPLNGIIIIISSLFCVIVGHKILGKYAKYLSL